MSTPYTPITLAELTEATTAGSGVFDVLMQANKAHLEQEFLQGRIKGNEYATVYLGSLQAVLQTALQFTLESQKQNLDAELAVKRIELATIELQKAQAEVALVNAQITKLGREDSLVQQQILNLQAEALNIPKQGQLIDAQKEVQVKQALNLASEKLRIEAQTQQLAAETLNVPKQGLLIDAQAAVQTQQQLNLVSEKIGIESRTALTNQQAINAVTENTVLVATECKLRAEFDLLMSNVLKSAAETSLLNQKKVTEQAQTTAMGVDGDSMVGRQKALYAAQAAGFQRDAEQKAADLMIKSWATRRTTNEDTPADGLNKLSDQFIGQAVQKMLTGIGA
jgi:hypothetical protein